MRSNLRDGVEEQLAAVTSTDQRNTPVHVMASVLHRLSNENLTEIHGNRREDLAPIGKASSMSSSSLEKLRTVRRDDNSRKKIVFVHRANPSGDKIRLV